MAPVAAGAAAGAFARWAVFALVDSATGALIVVNLAGTMLLAVVLARQASDARGGRPVAWQLDFAATGFCGALTTFSTLAVDLAQRLDDGERLAPTALLVGLLLAGITLYAGAGRLAGDR
ncbi:MAG: CrcB family protein [Actinomycetia bacterium]|nr:CrcB family protein [Actinomycetes bacterium]MCP4087426.1 CrcB family protein [Actinomycetes bacterium]